MPYLAKMPFSFPIGSTLELTEIDPCATRTRSRDCAQRGAADSSIPNTSKVRLSIEFLPVAYRWCLCSFFLVLLLELGDHRRVGESRRVAERAAVGDVAEQPAHDLAAARLGQLGGEEDLVGPRDRAD